MVAKTITTMAYFRDMYVTVPLVFRVKIVQLTLMNALTIPVYTGNVLMKLTDIDVYVKKVRVENYTFYPV